MTLLDSELNEIRWLMGYPMLTTGAEPYVGIAAAFDRVIQPYLRAGAKTSSSTAVSAATTPAPVAITLLDATGFAAGDRVVVDVDTRQEIAVVQALSGSAITVQLALAHSGTYPVTVEGGEAVVREILRKARGVRTKLETVAQSAAGVAQADEVKFKDGSKAGRGGGSVFEDLTNQLLYWADEMTFATGLANLRRLRRGSGSMLTAY